MTTSGMPPHDRGGRGDAERAQLRERLELAFRQVRLAERRIRDLTGDAAVETEVIELADAPWQSPPSPDPAPDPAPDPTAEDDIHPGRAVPGDAGGAPSWWAADRTDCPPPLTPRPGWACSTLAGQPVRAIGISVCGFDGATLRQVVAMIADQQQRGRSFVPVFLTDTSDTAVFEEYGYAYEYLPGDDRRHAFPWITDWAAYLADRRRLVERKWNLSEVIVFGATEFGR